MSKKRAMGVAFSQDTGLTKYIEVYAADRLAVDAITLCKMLGYEYSSATMKAFIKNGLPKPKAPAGSDRWDLDEVREWWAHLCPRANTERVWPAKRRERFEAERRQHVASEAQH